MIEIATKDYSENVSIEIIYDAERINRTNNKNAQRAYNSFFNGGEKTNTHVIDVIEYLQEKCDIECDSFPNSEVVIEFKLRKEREKSLIDAVNKFDNV